MSFKVALFENIHVQAVDFFARRDCRVIRQIPAALEGDELIAALQDVDIVGIRSKTRLTADILRHVPHLKAVGCFCIGTEQVDLTAAQQTGIPVFNAPYANTRSVAELVLGEIIMLLRRIPDKNKAAHSGVWLKELSGASEVRGKTLGIIGYGHIGTQLSILAENLGLRVVFYDVVNKLALGNAVKCASLHELLAQADIVSLHVPGSMATKDMIGAHDIAAMKEGSVLINASRGNVVDLDALASAVESGHLSGAAIDVFPVEPAQNGAPFASPLQNLSNVILTPHIGGNTIEAQENIAGEVTEKLVDYVHNGATYGAVNMPQVALPPVAAHTRFRHLHNNVPGMLTAINNVFSSRDVNIAAQYLQTNAQCGYVVIDADGAVDAAGILRDLQQIDGTIRAL